MVASQKNIAVWGSKCSNTCRDNCNADPICGLCRPCLSAKMRNSLLKGYKEFLHRGDFARLFPPPMVPYSLDEVLLKNLTETNKLQYLWYQGKCIEDTIWCT